MQCVRCVHDPRCLFYFVFLFFCTHLLCYEYICSTIEISIPLNVVALHRFPVTRRILFMDNTKALLKPSIMREQHYHCAGRWYWYTKPSYQPKVYTFINICRQFSDFQSIEWLCVCARILNVRYRKCCNFLFQSEKKNVFVGPQHTLNVDNKFLEEEYWMTTPSEGNTEHIRRHKHEQTGKKNHWTNWFQISLVQDLLTTSNTISQNYLNIGLFAIFVALRWQKRQNFYK